jgi:hypothetical protein
MQGWATVVVVDFWVLAVCRCLKCLFIPVQTSMLQLSARLQCTEPISTKIWTHLSQLAHFPLYSFGREEKSPSWKEIILLDGKIRHRCLCSPWCLILKWSIGYAIWETMLGHSLSFPSIGFLQHCRCYSMWCHRKGNMFQIGHCRLPFKPSRLLQTGLFKPTHRWVCLGRFCRRA